MKFMILVLIIAGAVVYARLQLAPSDVRQTIDQGLDTLQGMVEERKPVVEVPLPEASSPQGPPPAPAVDIPIPPNETAYPYQALIEDGIVLPGFGVEDQPVDSPPVEMAHAQDDAEPSPEQLQDRLQAIQQQLLTAIEIVEGK